MKYVSTRDKSHSVNLSEAIQRGLAPGGGLYVPEFWPSIKIDELQSCANFATFAAKLLGPFFEGDALAPHLSKICTEAFSFPLPMRALDSTTSVLELFHGPTCAFKDFGARFLALCSEQIPSHQEKQKLVLVATSGDTGGAVAAAFCTCTRTPVVILFPQGMVSMRQEKQLTSWGPQVKAFAVRGSFDDCQRMVKEAFLSPVWQNKFELMSANSINLGRLLPQMAYFAFASLRYFMNTGVKASLIIPSGNMGNSAAALWAKQLGFPIGKVIFAQNANRSVLNYFASGQWAPVSTVATLANAMDVGDPSNFERVRDLYPKLSELKKVADVISVSDDEIRQAIQQADRQGMVVCPHTATGIWARAQYKKEDHFIIAATADPAKFETIVEPLLGKTVELPVQMRAILAQPSTSTVIASRLFELENQLGVSN